MDSPPPATDTSTATTGQASTQDEAETETTDSDSTTRNADEINHYQPTADGPTVRTALGIADRDLETDAERPESDLDVLRAMDAALEDN